MTSAPDTWSVKYLRENPFISFGTMLQSYSRINEGKGISVADMMDVVDKLFEKSMELTKKAYESTQTNDVEVDIPEKQ